MYNDTSYIRCIFVRKQMANKTQSFVYILKGGAVVSLAFKIDTLFRSRQPAISFNGYASRTMNVYAAYGGHGQRNAT